MVNKNVLVSIDNKNVLGNKIIMEKDTAGRKDMVFATVVNHEPSDKGVLGIHATVCFPYYAASPVTIEGQPYFIVSEDDIVFVTKK